MSYAPQTYLNLIIVTGRYKTNCNVAFSTITTNKTLFMYNENPKYE